MLKSEILELLQNKYKKFTPTDIENLFGIFVNKIAISLKNSRKVEIRGFGTISKKLNKEKFVRNPKTNEKIFKNNSYKIHFKIGKTLHSRINSKPKNEF